MIAVENDLPIERHPLPPFLPEGATVLQLGSFPPARVRWSMEFFYPNFQNDMWRIMGLLWRNDKDYFCLRDERRFDMAKVQAFCREAGIALYDTALAVQRLSGTASDKDLLVVEPTDIGALLRRLPYCRAIVSTGQKSAEMVGLWSGSRLPAIGTFVHVVHDGREYDFWRMPSSSRAYPLALEKKAVAYGRLRPYFRTDGD